MRTYFVDTSALLKCYFDEEGSDWMEQLLDQEDRITISTLTRVEVASSFQRLFSVDRTIDRPQFHEIWASFLLDLAEQRFTVIGAAPEIVDRAIRLLLEVYATPVDALQIATAMSLGNGVVVVSSDQKMNRMLSTAGLVFVDPASPHAETPP